MPHRSVENNEVMAIVRDYTPKNGDLSENGSSAGSGNGGRIPYGLSFREYAVLQLLADGVTDKEIAVQLHISVYTVNKHVASILGKMRAASRTEAAVRASRERLVD
jgi:DNA-binding NarL/FixJ family response regulator